MMRPCVLSLIFAMGCFSFVPLNHAEEVGIRAPQGFEVTLFAGDDLAHDIYSMTVDSRGRVVVSGPSYIKILPDENRDGKADRALLFSDQPKSGAHGLLSEGNELFYTGDDGVWKLTDANRDDQADGPAEIFFKGLAHKEHGANGLARGPDGWLYLICGNDAGVTAEFVNSPNSPVKKPNCGTVLRFSPDGKKREIVADGFRNPYDLCFHPNGNIFAVDADGERDHHLPWYAPTRLFDVATGMHHGWVLNGWVWSWNRPASYFDNVERCAEIDRGSPTGMLAYRHTQFPAKYRGGIFSACWTFGRVYHFPLVARESTYDSKPEVFLETTGQVGFAPVDMTVGPEGEMYVAIGGRHTRGSVFCVRYKGTVSELTPSPQNKVEEVISAPQPLDAWSRAKWLPVAKELNEMELANAVINARIPLSWRVRAIEIAAEFYPGCLNPIADKIKTDPAPEIVARYAWALGQERNVVESSQYKVLAHLTNHTSPVVRRAAWESLASEKPDETNSIIDAAWRWNNKLEDRRILAARVLSATQGWKGNDDDYRLSFEKEDSEGRLWLEHYLGKDDPASASALAQKLLEIDPNSSKFLRTLRLLVIKLGDVNIDPNRKDALPGYALNNPVKSSDVIPNAEPFAKIFPTKNDETNRELARLFGLLGMSDVKLIERVARQITKESNPHADIHYLMCLSRMPGFDEEAAKHIADGFVMLPEKMQSRRYFPSRNWPARIGETLTRFTEQKHAFQYLVGDRIRHPSQLFLALRLAPGVQAQIAAKMLKNFVPDGDNRWTNEMIQLATRLPSEDSQIVLRKAWDEISLRDEIVSHLAKSPHAIDREKFVEVFSSYQPTTVEIAIRALQSLEIDPMPDELLVTMQALRQACSQPAAKKTREAIVKALEKWSGEKFTITEEANNLLAAYEPCFAWFTKKFPEEAKKLKQGTTDLAAWNERLAKLAWTTGDEGRGKVAFDKFSCSRCHAGTSPLGPDLRGAAGRFSRDDLFAAILDPSRDIAPLYQTTQIETASGKIVQGFVVYESPDSTILTTGPDTSVRVTGDEIISSRKSRISFMPAGLLNAASDQDLTDLYKYLQSLRQGK